MTNLSIKNKRSFLIIILISLVLTVGCSKENKVSTGKSSQEDYEDKNKNKDTIENTISSDLVSKPFDFKEVKLGMSKAEVRKLFPKLSNIKNDLGCNESYDFAICSGKVTIAGEPPKVLLFTFQDEKLTSIIIFLKHGLIKSVEEGLKEKFGMPTITVSENPLDVMWRNVDGSELRLGENPEELSSDGLYILESKEKLELNKNMSKNAINDN